MNIRGSLWFRNVRMSFRGGGIVWVSIGLELLCALDIAAAPYSNSRVIA